MKRKSYLFAVLTVAVWSTMAAVVKSLLSDIPDLEALSVSSAFAFLFLLAVNTVTGKIRTVKDTGLDSSLRWPASGSSVFSCILRYITAASLS